MVKKNLKNKTCSIFDKTLSKVFLNNFHIRPGSSFIGLNFIGALSSYLSLILKHSIILILNGTQKRRKKKGINLCIYLLLLLFFFFFFFFTGDQNLGGGGGMCPLRPARICHLMMSYGTLENNRYFLLACSTPGL